MLDARDLGVLAVRRQRSDTSATTGDCGSAGNLSCICVSPDVSVVARRYDIGNDGYLDLEELKRMMEKLGAPQTHIGLKQMIREATEDDAVHMISFRAVRRAHIQIQIQRTRQCT